MRVLVVIPHYFHPEARGVHSSVDATRRTDRARAVDRVISAWRHDLGGPQAILNIERKRFETVNPVLNDVTLVVLTTRGRHLLDESAIKRHKVNIIDCKIDDPRMLGHETPKIFADNAHRFDLFIFSEDDLLVGDSLFLEKACWFFETFGYSNTLMPNRYEWNPNGPAYKTFIDGDLRPRAWERWVEGKSGGEFLAAMAFGTSWSFRRARNPHSGMHILSREQVDYWRRQPHWGDKDIAFIGPLESAATLGILKTFSIYKTWGRSLGYFAVEHLDHRFSDLPNRIPQTESPRAISQNRRDLSDGD